MGLSEFINRDSEGKRLPRRAEWNRPNDKALANLKVRQAAWDKQSEEWKAKTTRPGSMKLP